MAKKAKKAPAKKKDTKGAVKKRVLVKKKVAAGAKKQAKAASAKAKQSRTASKVTHKSKSTGLHLSAAQWRAYDSAYRAVEKSGHAQLDAKVKGQYASEALQLRRAAIAQASTTLRQSRLTASAHMQKAAAAAQKQASTASIALFATKMSLRQSHLAHQNAALEQRVYADYERHLQSFARKQYAAKGEKAFAHTAVMRTLTQAQAQTIEEAKFAHAVKAAKKASRMAAKSSMRSQAKSFSAAIKTEVRSADAVINANAKAAGLKAARAIPAPRKARRPAQVQRCTYRGTWFGTPGGEDCAAAAVGNSIIRQLPASTALRAALYETLRELIPDGATVAQGLDAVMSTWPELGGYDGTWAPADLRPGMIVCFPTEEGDHAAVLLEGGMIASWGEVLPLEDVATGGVEEAYEVFWRPVR